MRAAAYARFSTDNQSENSIDTQLAAIGKYCLQEGHSIVSTFTDMAMTGTNVNRPEFQRMIHEAREKKFEAVVIYDITRGSRDIADWFSFRKDMQALNITVLSVTEKLGDISNPSDFLMEFISVGLGQHTVLQTRQKSIAGVAQKAQQGVFLGGVAPLGYNIVDGKYVINEREAEIIRHIFSLYACGESYNTIIDRIAPSGVTGKRGKPIGKNSLHEILKNERYIGVYSWNKRKVKYMGKWAGGERNPDAVRIIDAIPAIIDIDTWERVQKRMSDNKRNATNGAKAEYLLSGLIECGECGGSFTGKTNTSGKGYVTRYYACSSKYRTRTCSAKNINADDIETAIVSQITNYLQTADFESIASEIVKEFERYKTARPEEEKELAKLKAELQNCLSAIKSGVVFPELNDEINRTRVRIAELEDVLSLPKKQKITKAAIIERLKKDAADVEITSTRQLIKSYVTKIIAHSDEVVITGGVNLNGCGGRI